MRIVLVTDSYPPFIGGADRQAQLIGKEMVRLGHEVSVATSWQTGLLEYELEPSGVHVYRIKGLVTRVPWFSVNPVRRHHPPIPDMGTTWGLRRLIDRVKPDLVHSYGWISYSCAAALLGKRIPMLLSARDYGYICPVRMLLRNGRLCDGPGLARCLDCSSRFYGGPKGIAAVAGVFGSKALLKHKMHGLHTVSAFVDATMEQHLLDASDRYDASQDRVRAIIHSFREQSSQAEPDPAFLAELPTEPFILYVGGLQTYKGVLALLDAYQRLVSPPPMVLIGTRWPETPDEFPPGVRAFYNIPHHSVMAAWNRCLFGVAPSIWPEPFGSVIHEGMSQGKAMIGTAPGGHPDMIVHNESGLIIPQGDVEALAQAMRQLIDNVEQRERLGRAARVRAARFTAEQIIPLFEQLYRQVVADFHGTSRGQIIQV